MRMALLLLSAALLAACGDPDAATEAALADAGKAAEEDGRLACAVDGATAFEPVCAMERRVGPDGTTLTIRHPSGSFRRLLIVRDGRGVVAADGADPARVTIRDDAGIEVAIAGDSYRLPATIKPRP